MTWHAYRLVYKVKSPLHVGWRKMGNLMQTRLYITGRNWWGAATNLLTQRLDQYDYRRIGNFVKDNLIFGYFFLSEGPETPLLPYWEKGELQIKPALETAAPVPLKFDQLEQLYLNSMASASIDHQSETAAEGQLHEVEFIAPKDSQGQDVYLMGHLFVSDSHVECQPTKVIWNGIDIFAEALKTIQIGGERRYGFGCLELAGTPNEVKDIFGQEFVGNAVLPLVKMKKDHALPFHCLAQGLDAEGEIEPLIGREWDEDRGPGQVFAPERLMCWTPGSAVKSDCDIQIGPLGIGKRVITHE